MSSLGVVPWGRGLWSNNPRPQVGHPKKPPHNRAERSLTMIDFLADNAGTIIISAALLVILCFAVISIMKDKKRGSVPAEVIAVAAE